MSGLVGGRIDGRKYARNTPIHGRKQETEFQFENGNWELYMKARKHGSNNNQIFHKDGNMVCIYGAPTVADEVDIFNGVLDRPVEVAKTLDGTFLISAIDTDTNKVIVLTDKLGARSCYYVPGEPVFATSVSACLKQRSVEIDRQAIADFLLLGHLWGNRTLLSEVKAMRPSTVYEFKDGEWHMSRYWKPTYDESTPGTRYLEELADRFKSAVAKTADTIPDRAGLWLSGGLDSRSTAAAFPTESINLTGYTYNANPPTGDNPAIAHRVGRKIGINVKEVPLSEVTVSPERIERLIDVCDGMVRWNTTLNLSASYDVCEPVLLEGVEGSLMGDHLLRNHFTNYSDPVESQIASEAWQPIDVVKNHLNFEIEPTRTFREEAERTPEETYRRQVLDIHFQNYYNRLALASNAVMRDVASDRVVYTDGEYLDWCARLPLKYRKGVFPGTKNVPTGTSRAKLGLTKRVATDTAWITYERTKLPPILPYPFHVLGFVSNVLINRTRNEATYGNGQLADFWLRSGGAIADWSKRHLQNAADRPIFSDRLAELWTRHQNGENLSPLIAQITTLEWWIATYVDE